MKSCSILRVPIPNIVQVVAVAHRIGLKIRTLYRNLHLVSSDKFLQETQVFTAFISLKCT